MGRFNASDLQALEGIWSGEAARALPRASAQQFHGLDDPRLLEFIRTGQAEPEGAFQLRNMAVLRCVTLICGTVGMLPVNLIAAGPEKRIASEHPAHRLLKVKPNPWQTPLEFKRQLQLSMLRHGDGYAQIIWSGSRPIALKPLDSKAMKPELDDRKLEMVYRYSTKDGEVVLPQREVFHLRDLSVDGVKGMSRMRLAEHAIRLAEQAEEAARRVFTHGNMAGGSIEVPNALSDTAYSRMRGSLDTEFAGTRSAQRLMLLEEGAKANFAGSTARDAQHIENRNAQVQEVARLFGVPRPLLFMDDTSWGSGIEQLGIFFLQYTMHEHFVNWEQAAARSLLSEREAEQYQHKFNERALMRGTLKDQADFFAKALGAGGHAPWHSQNEVRELLDYPESDQPGTDQLRNPMTQSTQDDPATSKD
jgi:HK97 family phage portal protein